MTPKRHLKKTMLEELTVTAATMTDQRKQQEQNKTERPKQQ